MRLQPRKRARGMCLRQINSSFKIQGQIQSISVSGEKAVHSEQRSKQMSDEVKHIHKASRGNDQSNHQRTVKSKSSFFFFLPEICWHWNLASVFPKTVDLLSQTIKNHGSGSSKERCRCAGEEFSMSRKEMELMRNDVNKPPGFY